jgi:anti-anti-sigma factor
MRGPGGWAVTALHLGSAAVRGSAIPQAYPLASPPIVVAQLFECAPAGAGTLFRRFLCTARLWLEVKSESAADARTRLTPDLEVAAVSESFHVTSESANGSQRIFATGELDIATVPVLEEAFDAAVATDAALIVVDLGGITFIDSTGLRLLIKMNDVCADGRLGIRSTAIVDRLLQVTGLLDQLPLVGDDPA